MKPVLKTSLISVVSAVVGGAIVFGAIKYRPSLRTKAEAEKKMRKQMERRMEEFGSGRHSMSNPFDSWFSNKFGGGTINDISKREDSDYVYYDIQVDDLNATSINTRRSISLTHTGQKTFLLRCLTNLDAITILD